MLGFLSFQKSHIELSWTICNSWEVIFIQATAQKLSIRIIQSVFHCNPTIALDERGLNVGNIYSRVDSFSNIHDNVSAKKRVLTSQNINLHKRAGSTCGEVPPSSSFLCDQIKVHKFFRDGKVSEG